VTKESFRKKSLERLRDISLTKRYYHDKKIEQLLGKIIAHLKPKKIMGFVPLEMEPNILPLLKKGKMGRSVVLPFMEGVSFRVVKYTLPLRKKAFNIYEPLSKRSEKKQIDLMIVPVVGIDTHFCRIGFGKGMYDRFYGSLKKRPTVVFVQRVPCVSTKVLTHPFDVQGDILVTSAGYLLPKSRNYGNYRDISRKRLFWSRRLYGCKKS
jgi:5-formyltetrahydrofolate cyclo-ligase